MIGYQSTFYIKSNIIGYTGNIAERDRVTVYFFNKYRFGHITQTHCRLNNIGREKVKHYRDYQIRNNNRSRCEEFFDGHVRHISRSRFHAVQPEDTETLSILAHIIRLYPERKSKYDRSSGNRLLCCC